MVYILGFGALPLLLVATLPSWPQVEAACYYPSGQIAPNDTPCRDDTEHATCCGQGYACLSNGICQATGEEQLKDGATEFVRGSCTDRRWRSSSCPLFCIEEGVDFLDGGNGIFKCPNTTEDLYFCINRLSGADATCDNKRNLLFFAGVPSAITTIGVVPRITSSSLSSSSNPSAFTLSTVNDRPTSAPPAETRGTRGPTSQSPPDDSVDEPSASSNNTAVIVGAVLGGTVAIFLAGLVGWMLARGRSRRGKATGGDAVAAMPGHRPDEAPPRVPFSRLPSRTDDAFNALSVWKPQDQQGPFELGYPTPRPGPPVEMPAELPTGYR
ncbi:hypothetical protein VTK26DRAFT_8946 [Humicola hyalothermophila]